MQKTLWIASLLVLACLVPCYGLTLTSVQERTVAAGQVFSGIHSSSNLNAYACGFSDIRTTANGATTWSDNLTPGADNYTAINVRDANTAFVCHTDQILKTIDGGLNWGPTVVPGGALPTNGLKGITFSPSGTIGLAVGDDAGDTNVILRSTNSGANWAFVAGANVPGMRGAFWGVFFKDNNNAWVCGLYSSGGTEYMVIYRSTDAGATWTQAYSGPSGVSRILYSIAVKGNLGIAIGEQGEVIRSTDGGMTWSRQNPLSTAMAGFSINLIDEKTMVAAFGSLNLGTGAIYYSEDGGLNWSVYRSYATTQMRGITLSGDRLFMSGGTAGTSGYLFSAQYSPQVASCVVAGSTSKVVSQGTTKNITITGDNFDMYATVNFGAGITVNSVTYNSCTSLTANITVDPAATTGDRTATVANNAGNGGTGALAAALTVDQPLALTSAKQGTGGINNKLTQQYNGNLVVAGYFPAPTTFSFNPATAVTINNTTRTSATEYILNVSVSTAAPAGTGTVALSALGQNQDSQTLALDVIANSNPPTLNQVKINDRIISAANYTSPVTVSQNSKVYASFNAGTANFGTSNYNAKVICETPNGISIINISDAKVTRSDRTLSFEDTVFIPVGSTVLKVYVEDSAQMNTLTAIPVAISVAASNLPPQIRDALVYPNPIRNFPATLRYFSNTDFRCRIFIVDSAAQIAKEITQDVIAGWNTTEIDGKHIKGGEFANGIYNTIFTDVGGSGIKGKAKIAVARGNI